MPIDPNEAPEGTISVEHQGDVCPGSICCLYDTAQCAYAKCHREERKDKTGCYFIEKPQPTETKPMEDEYEYLVADSMDNCKTLADWFFNTSGGIIYYLSDSRWSVAPGIFLNSHYRRKKPLLSSGVICLKPGCKLPPKKTKKLVPRTAEEFWPLIGLWWFRHKDGEPRRLITSSDFSKATQEYWEIAPLGSEEWRPMMKEVEVEE